MFSKFQTPMHLKIDLDQVHFTELEIKKKSSVNNKKHQNKTYIWVMFNTRLSPSSFFPDEF